MNKNLASEQEVRSRLIRLAHANPELRSRLLPLLKEANGHQPYVEGPLDFAILRSLKKVSMEVASLLHGKITQISGAFDPYGYDSDGAPTIGQVSCHIQGSFGGPTEVSVRIELIVTRMIASNPGGFDVYRPGIHAYIDNRAANAAFNSALLNHPPFKLVAATQILNALDDIPTAIAKALDLAEAAAFDAHAKEALVQKWITSMVAGMQTMVPPHWKVSHSLYRSLMISGIVTPEIAALNPREQRAALAPLVTKTRALATRAAARFGIGLQIKLGKAYFSRNILHIELQIALPNGQSI